MNSRRAWGVFERCHVLTHSFRHTEEEGVGTQDHCCTGYQFLGSVVMATVFFLNVFEKEAWITRPKRNG